MMLNQLSQANNLIAIFDTYRIDEVEVTFFPMFRANAFPTTVGNILVPLIYTAVDLDDSASPGGVFALEEYGCCQIHSDDKPFSFSYKPKWAAAAYAGMTTGYAVAGGWLDCGYPSVQHFGWKYAVTPGATGQTALQVWNVSMKVKVSFKNVR